MARGDPRERAKCTTSYLANCMLSARSPASASGSPRAAALRYPCFGQGRIRPHADCAQLGEEGGIVGL